MPEVCCTESLVSRACSTESLSLQTFSTEGCVPRVEVEQDCFFPLLMGTRLADPDPGGQMIIWQGSAP